ncbi:hypothetical protein Zm00014a_015012 [Zea mays]|uniref:BHLH domain-containing protein n=2 Tax=Zea mays TaxID=4577 RepID=A0A3L6D6N1_MAIZE|nr:hypothetical protein Zm00014a_015012 [Zea mays]PWZ04188.1 hypothetical protein Zm00014a_015012 [Zea mays]PWZ04189.1 hypothetical protein Zm00014a_015012 [Zea mays]
MKLLQDLVPGCNKVVGKAVMLDEIINSVQSLQRQVEFLSMKLATVNPQLDFNNLPNLLPKDAAASQRMDNSQSSMHPLDPAFCRPMSSQQHPFLNGVSDAASQVGTFWQDDLQSVVHMDMGSRASRRWLPPPPTATTTVWKDSAYILLHRLTDTYLASLYVVASSDIANCHPSAGRLQTVHMKMELLT